MGQTTLKEKAAKGLFWGGISNGLQQLFTAFFGIYFARHLTQDDYGLIGVLGIFMAVASTIQEGGFTAGLINRKGIKHEDYNAVFWFSSMCGLVLFIVFFCAAPLIADFFKDPRLVSVSRVYFLWFFIGSLSIAHNAQLQKELKVRERAIIDVSSLLISNTVGLAMIVLGYSYWALVIQTVIFSLIGTGLRWFYSSFKPSWHFNISPLKEMFPFSIKLVLTGFISSINANILSVFLGRFFTKPEVGNYTQGNKWSAMGSTFINNMLQGIAQPVLVESGGDPERQRQVFRKMLRFIAFISFPLMMGLAFVAKELIVVMITDKWSNSIPIMQLVCIWGAFLPISTLYSQLLFSHGKSNVYLWINTITGVVQILILRLIYPFGIHTMLAVFIGINLLGLAAWQYFANKTIGIKMLDVLKDIFPYIIITIGVLTAAYYITRPVTNIYLLLSLKIFISVILYILVMRLSNSVMYKDSVEYIKMSFNK